MVQSVFFLHSVRACLRSCMRVSAGGSLVSDLVLGSLVEIKCWLRLKVQVVTAGTF